MILNKYSLNFIYQISKGIFKICIFSKVSIKVEKILYTILHTDCVAYFLRYCTSCYKKMSNFSKKKRFYVIKRGKFFIFQIGRLTYQIKIDIYDNYVCSELNFFYFRKGTYQIFIIYTASVA